MAACIAVTSLSLVPLASTSSGAAGAPPSSAYSRAQAGSGPRAAPEKCPAVQRALKWYMGRASYWQAKMGAGNAGRPSARKPSTCPRYMANLWKRKARSTRLSYQRWWEYQYAWWQWMPAKHQRVAACETGHQGGTGPGGSRWDWDSGRYVSAFGIYRAGYDDDAHRIGNLGWDETIRKLHRYPTPREQMQAADSHRAAHGGWSGWGCAGA